MKIIFKQIHTNSCQHFSEIPTYHNMVSKCATHKNAGHSLTIWIFANILKAKKIKSTLGTTLDKHLLMLIKIKFTYFVIGDIVFLCVLLVSFLQIHINHLKRVLKT